MPARQSAEELKKKYLQAVAYERKLAAAAKAADAKKERKAETRRLLLQGALNVALAKKDEAFKAQNLKQLDAFLTRPADRELFGLPERAQ